VEWYRRPRQNGGGRHRTATPAELADAVVRLAFDGLRAP
jgi:hypothetical protein